MISHEEIFEIQKYYRGFELTSPEGNNAFSFDKRVNKKIYVPALRIGSLSDLKVSETIAFSEIVDEQEKNCHGLNCLLHLNHPTKNIFIMDNHNHAFFFWMVGWIGHWIPKNACLIHVDQHKDMRVPNPFLHPQERSLEKIFHYTNHVLNVGNFIEPALELGIFSNVMMVDNQSAFEQRMSQPYILDIDLDIFSKEMAYINQSYKIEKIRSWIDRAQWITVATSPFFIEQDEALRLLTELF